MNLAYDYSDVVLSEYIGLYLDDSPGCNWGDLLEQLINQYSDNTSATDAARALIKIKQREGETLSELAGRVLGLAMVAYKDAVQREREAVQAQQAEYYTDAIENMFVREDTARAAQRHWRRRLRRQERVLGSIIGSQPPRGGEKKWDGQERRERGGQRLILLLGTKEGVATRAIVGETTPMRGDGEGHFLTQNNWGVGSVDSWVTCRGSDPEWDVHYWEGGLLEGSGETWGAPRRK